MMTTTTLDETLITELGNGMRAVCRQRPGAVEYAGVAVDAGSRDELPGEEGLAHFVEHTLFKGTSKRRAWHILNRMEAVGGELNAYTTKEETIVYSIFPAGALNRATELIADLIADSSFPPAEIDKEREVVIDEINSYLDTPSENVFDLFEDRIFAGSSLGHNILGNADSVRRFTTDECRRWLDRSYTPSRLVAFYMGRLPPQKALAALERHFGKLDRPDTRPSRELSLTGKPFAEAIHCDGHQSHTVTGATMPGLYSPLQRGIMLMSNVIGGPGMNAQLNVELRERRGLVYSVDSSLTAFTDTGLLEIYYGCDPSDRARCTEIVRKTLKSISAEGLKPRQLDAAKKQYIGQLIVASQNSEQLALSTARAVLYGLPVNTLDRVIADVEALTPEKMADVYPLFSPDRFSSLTLD